MNNQISQAMKLEGLEIWKKWVNLKGEAKRLRGEVDRVELAYLEKNEWVNKRSGERILKPGLAYMVSDIERYCKELEGWKREAGLMEGIDAGFCPALIAENNVVKWEWVIFDYLGRLVGDRKFAENVNINFNARGKALDLFDALNG